jgi:nicotinamidase-related amidase
MRLAAARSTLLLVDVQARLFPVIREGEGLVQAIRKLALGAKILGVPVLATEQNPSGIGATIAPLADLPERVIEKRFFDAAREAGFLDALPRGRQQIVLVGTESHVCVLQTALGLLDQGFEVAVVTDAVGSRREADRNRALVRLEAKGALLATVEMVLFEWLESCDHPRFREVLALIR